MWQQPAPVTQPLSAVSQPTVDIHDDGADFDVEATRQNASGKGPNSLEKHAPVPGARLAITSTGQGTRTLLVVPLGGVPVPQG